MIGEWLGWFPAVVKPGLTRTPRADAAPARG